MCGVEVHEAIASWPKQGLGFISVSPDNFASAKTPTAVTEHAGTG